MALPYIQDSLIATARTKGKKRAEKAYENLYTTQVGQEARFKALRIFFEEHVRAFRMTGAHFRPKKQAAHRDDTLLDEKMLAFTLYDSKAALDQLHTYLKIEATSEPTLRKAFRSVDGKYQRVRDAFARYGGREISGEQSCARPSIASQAEWDSPRA